jgi:hypothetical protein
LATLRAAVGQPDLAKFVGAINRAPEFAEFEDLVRKSVGKTGLMMFMELDHGAILRKESGLDTPKNGPSGD